MPTCILVPAKRIRARLGIEARPGIDAGLRRAALLLLTLGLAWRLLRYALCFPFWGDEAYLNINYLHRGFGELATPLEYSQISPVGFLWLQRAVYLVLGGGEYALRLMPLLAGIGALLLFSRLARQILTQRGALLATAIFAASYYLMRHTCESKPYAMDLMAATLLVWLGQSWLQVLHSPRRAAAFAGCATVAVWLSYPAVFVAGGVLAVCGAQTLRVWIGGRSRIAPAVSPRRDSSSEQSALVATATLRVDASGSDQGGSTQAALERGSCRAVLAWLGAAAGVTASFAAFYFLFAIRQGHTAAGSWLEDSWRESFPPLKNPLAGLWWLFKIHTGRMFAYPTGGPNFGSTPITLLCLVGAIALWRAGRRRLLALLVAPALLTLLAAALRKYPYGGSARVALHLAPAICLAAGAGVATLLERLRRRETCERVQGLVLGGLLLLIIGGAVRDVARPFKEREDVQARAVMRQLAPTLASAEGVATVNPLYGAWGPPEGPKFEQTLRYYFELYTRRRLEAAAVSSADGGLSEHTDRPTLHWLLAYRDHAFGPTREFVADQLAQHSLQIASTQTFSLSADGQALTLYELAQPH